MRIFFQGEAVNGPILSRISQKLKLNINILLANIDRIDGVSCGVIVLELEATPDEIKKFMAYCAPFNLIIETLGYITHDVL